MRLALTHAYSWPEVRRGAERIIHELSRALARRGHEVVVLTAGDKPGRTHSDGVTTVRFRRIFRDPARHEQQFAMRLVPALATGGFDCVHSLGARDAAASIRAGRLRGKKRHRTVYTNLGNPAREWWDLQPERRSHALVVREVDVYGGMSRYSLRVLEESYRREGTLTPGGVNLAQFAPAIERAGEPTILFSGAMNEWRKGVAVLMEACSLLIEGVPQLRLRLSGPGDPEPLLAAAPDAVRTHVEALPIGDPEAQAERYGTAWVTALPSKYDSFGMVLVESLACGTPIVASNDWALPELVLPGRTGALCDPDDPRSVADALLVALDLSQRGDTAQACRASAAQYDWDSGIAPLFEQMYQGAINEARDRARPSG